MILYVQCVEKLKCSKIVKWPEGIRSFRPWKFRLDFLYSRFLTVSLYTVHLYVQSFVLRYNRNF